MTLMALSVMLSSCETRITESFINGDADKVIPASENIQSGVVPDMMRIKLSQDMADEFINACGHDGYVSEEALSRHGLAEAGLQVRTTFMIGGRFLERQKAAGLDRWFDVIYDSPEIATKAGNLFALLSGVEYSEPVYKTVSKTAVMNDPLLSAQWQFNNTGKYNFKEGIDIRLDEAWERYGRYGNESVVVAVVDAGVDYEHEDLSYNMWINTAEADGAEGIDDDGNGYIDDIHGFNFVRNSGAISPDDHGTHVAGVISAVNGNETGISSIAGGKYPDKGVRIMSLQTMEGEGGAVNIERVFQYAAENGAVICQNSWGYEEVSSIPVSAKVAIDYFIENAGRDENGNQTGPMDGGLVVFAAGNESLEVGYPAMYESCMAVAAIGPTGKYAYYTCYGDWVDVCAPGGDLQFDAIRGGVYSTLTGNTYGGLQGTSMACPQVSGLAALLVSEFGGPGFTSSRLRQVIEDSCDPDIYKYNSSMEGKLGKGMIDVVNAIASFSTIPPASVTEHTLEVVSNIAHFRIDLPEDPDDGNVYAIEIKFERKDGEGNAVYYKEAVDTSKIDSEGFFPVSVGGFEFETEYTYRIAASDYAGNVSEFTQNQSFVTGANRNPVISADDTETIKVSSTSVETRRIQCSDPDGHAIEFSLTTDAPAGVSCVESSADYILKVDGSMIPDGDYKCILTFIDEYGADASISFEISAGNSAPIIRKAIPDIFINGVGNSVELDYTAYFYDEDGESLKLTFDFEDGDIANVMQKGKNIIFTSASVGTTKITVTAADPAGEKVSSSLGITVRDDAKPFDIFPNPATDVINIRTGTEQQYQIAIFNATGRKVMEHTDVISMSKVIKLDVSGLPTGNYSISLDGEDGSHSRSTFIKL